MTRSLGLNRWSSPMSNGLANEEKGRGGATGSVTPAAGSFARFSRLFDEQTSKNRGQQSEQRLEQARSVAEEAEDQGDSLRRL